MARKVLRFCVLGGTGFVGTELVSRLAAAGHWVRVPTRHAGRGNHLRVLPTVELVRANVHDPAALARLIGGVDVVVNLVGILNERGAPGAGFRAAHVELPVKVLEAMRAARVRRLLHMSALGADAERGPSQYLRTKGEAEARIRAAASSIDFTIFRPSVIFGRGDSLTSRFARLLRLGMGFLPLARARARFAPIHVGDVAAAFVKAVDDPATIGRSYDLCGPHVMTLADIVRLTAEAAGLPCRIIPVPDFLARVQALVMGVLPGKPFTLDNFRSLTVDSVCSDDGCARLGIRPAHMEAIVPLYLGDRSARTRRFNRSRRH